MRALSTGDMNTKHFAATLLLIGNGSIPHTGEDSVIDVPKKLGTQVQTEDELIHEVYHNINVLMHLATKNQHICIFTS